jgi:hypothetical protein
MGLNKLFIIALGVMFIFSLLGVTIFINIIHELGHQRDLKGTVYDDKVCILEWSRNMTMTSGIASYSYTINASNLDAYYAAHKNTELKSHIIDGVIIMLYSLCLFITANHYKKNKSYKIQNATNQINAPLEVE